MTQPIITIDRLTKRFGNIVAVDDVSFEIPPNEFFALLGPSGCGKTTLLRMLAGFETPTKGRIILDGQDMSKVPPNRRPVNMVFQSYAVFPHMSVSDNVAYGLKVAGEREGDIAGRVKEALGMVKLGEFANRHPDQLSGGQRQRVALARALVKRPKVLLLDEPLSALDAKLREQMRLELSGLQESVGITFIIVTHDQDEALSMADRIAVMEDGRVSQIATPEELYERPRTRFIADFIGKVNLFDGKAAPGNGKAVKVSVDGLGDLNVPHDENVTGSVALAVRPEKLKLSKKKPSGQVISIKGRIVNIAYYGNASHVYLQTETGLSLTADIQNETRSREADFDIGDTAWIAWKAADTLILGR